MSDRIAVMREGRLVAILDRNQATEELVAAYALGTIADSTGSPEQAGNK
jgi:ABC-type sugar transport system ATPase subunit